MAQQRDESTELALLEEALGTDEGNYAPYVGDYEWGEIDGDHGDNPYNPQHDPLPEDDQEDNDDDQSVQDTDGEEDVRSQLAAVQTRLEQQELAAARQREAFLQAELETLRGKLTQENEANKPAPFNVRNLLDEAEVNLTEEQLAGAAPEVREAILRLAKQAALDVLEKYDTSRYQPIEQELNRVNRVEQDITEFQQQQAAARQQHTANLVLEVNPWVSQVKDTPEYKAFLDARVPGTNFKRGEMVRDALNRGDTTVINEILASYPGRPQGAQAQQTLGVASSPGRAQARAPQNQGTGQRQTFDYKLYEQALNKVTRGEMSHDEFAKIEAAYYRFLGQAGR